MSTNAAVKTKVNVRTLVQIGMLSALAIILMQFEIPLPFAPAFYKIDFSEVPVLVGCFSMGPFAGILIELIKVILNLAIKGTMTMGIGDAANFLIGCAFCVPAALIYQKKHTKSGAAAGMAVGTVCMTVIGCVLNAYILLPVYAKAFEMPLDSLIAMGTEVNSAIDGLMAFVLLAVAPFNLLKGMLVSLIVLFVYKKIRQVLL
nr:ECF transporter S component [uncultured Faecalimonas sp.]